MSFWTASREPTRHKAPFDNLSTSGSERSRTSRSGFFSRQRYFCDAHEMETNFNVLRMPDLRALAREHGLRGYSRLRKAELIAFLQDNLRLMPSPRPPSKPIPAPKPLFPQSVKLQLKRTRPPKLMRPSLPPPEEDSFDPYELG